MIRAITIIRQKREDWITKRLRTIARQDELINEGDKLTATAVGFSIDQQQQAISDMTNMITQLENILRHEKMVQNLINNKIKK
jgi:AraC-like DNA-binding protein